MPLYEMLDPSKQSITVFSAIMSRVDTGTSIAQKVDILDSSSLSGKKKLVPPWLL